MSSWEFLRPPITKFRRTQIEIINSISANQSAYAQKSRRQNKLSITAVGRQQKQQKRWENRFYRCTISGAFQCQLHIAVPFNYRARKRRWRESSPRRMAFRMHSFASKSERAHQNARFYRELLAYWRLECAPEFTVFVRNVFAVNSAKVISVMTKVMMRMIDDNWNGDRRKWSNMRLTRSSVCSSPSRFLNATHGAIWSSMEARWGNSTPRSSSASRESEALPNEKFYGFPEDGPNGSLSLG